MKNYAIYLNQEGGDKQNLGESDSLEEITKMWDDWKKDDDYGLMDEDIILVKLSDNVDVDDELIDCYVIPKSQQNF